MRTRTLTGIASVDSLSEAVSIQLDDYLRAASDYVRAAADLTLGQRKSAQIRLSSALSRALTEALSTLEPSMRPRSGEHNVAGALRIVQADVSELHDLDGLRLAIEIKPVNLAVGRAIWNRFGDIRTFAVNLHLKFPFAVVGGVLVVPTYEMADTRAGPVVKSTRHLIRRAAERLSRSGQRHSEGDAPHLLEGVALVVYDPSTGELDDDLPAQGTGLRWDEFVHSLVAAYRARFEILGDDSADDLESEASDIAADP